VNQDPASAFHFNADPDSHQRESAITGLQILHDFTLNLHASILSIHGPPRIHFQPLKASLMRFRIQLFILMCIWIQLSKSMRIWIRNPALKPTTTLYTTKKDLVALSLFFYLFLHLSSRHTIFIYITRRVPLLLSSLLSARHRASAGVPSRDSNSGLAYSKPTRYYLSYAVHY
jgi:hypothetical protein